MIISQGEIEMKPQLSADDIAIIADAVQVLVGDMKKESVHINQPRICDNCGDGDKEAFPFYANDSQGRLWKDLCNECFDELGCVYEVTK